MFELRLENDNENIININDGINYVVTHISGLTPPSASLFMAKSPNRKGGKYNGSTLNERQVVITIKILGDIEANRNALYPWIDTESYCKIHYRNGAKNVYCVGHVEDCPTDVFSQNEVISLAIVCGDPYWHDLNEIVTDMSGVIKHFIFPFAIDAAGVPFSTMLDTTVATIFNGGAETGVKITIRCNGEVENLTIYRANDLTEKFTLKTKLLKDWTIVVDTDGSPKTCKAYKPDGTVENFMKYVDRNPTWFVLRKGNNQLGYTADNGKDDAEITIGFTNKYLGV